MASFLFSFIVSIVTFISSIDAAKSLTAPNIIFILMDDLGWHDVSYNGGQFPTPNIDKLKDHSVELTRHYIHLMCSPSRTQFLTGRYAMRQGIGKMLPWDYTEIGGIPLGQPTVANWLQAAGYTTYAVGKWHCGYAMNELLPTSKGFDHFYGFYHEDLRYVDGTYSVLWEDGNAFTLQTAANNERTNSMHLYKDQITKYIESEENKKSPFYMYISMESLQSPLYGVSEFETICEQALCGNVARRSKYCQNMLITDDVIGAIIDSLKSNGMYGNTLLVLTSDNGADIANKGCNYPLRGTKGTQFDGNTRVIALVGGGYIPTKQYGTSRDALFSSLDWTPTLLHMAGALDKIDETDYSWDGYDQFELIMNDNNVVDRDHIVFNVGLRNLESATIVFKYDDHLYKYISDDPSTDRWEYKYDGWCVPRKNEEGQYGVIHNDDIALAQAVDNKYLFDLTKDVSEKVNLLQLDEYKQQSEKLINYATKILNDYTQHPLFSEPFDFLWTKMDHVTSKNESFVGPFLTKNEYMNDLKDGLAHIQISKELKALYLNKWKAPIFTTKEAKEFTLASDKFHIQTHDESVLQKIKNVFSNHTHHVLVRATKDWWLGIIIGLLLGIAYVIRFYVVRFVYRIGSRGCGLLRKLVLGRDANAYLSIDDNNGL